MHFVRVEEVLIFVNNGQSLDLTFSPCELELVLVDEPAEVLVVIGSENLTADENASDADSP